MGFNGNQGTDFVTLAQDTINFQALENRLQPVEVRDKILAASMGMDRTFVVEVLSAEIHGGAIELHFVDGFEKGLNNRSC